jgi:large subunit ribosomal protein L31
LSYNSSKEKPIMKTDLHPSDYRFVVFEDVNDGSRILTRSTIKTTETTKWEDGKEYPLTKVHISASTHPFYTGTEKMLDMEGRVDRFAARANARQAHLDKLAKGGAKVKDVKDRPVVNKIGAAKFVEKKVSPKVEEKKTEAVAA